MKSPFLSAVAVAAGLLILCTSFYTAPRTVSTSLTSTPLTNEAAGPVARTGNLFWYTDNGTVYHDWTSISNEVIELETEYGVLVDGNPSGGTLLSSGYALYGYPHLVFASSYLYGHF